MDRFYIPRNAPSSDFRAHARIYRLRTTPNQASLGFRHVTRRGTDVASEIGIAYRRSLLATQRVSCATPLPSMRPSLFPAEV